MLRISLSHQNETSGDETEIVCAKHADEVAVLTELIVRDTDAQFSDLRAVELTR